MPRTLRRMLRGLAKSVSLVHPPEPLFVSSVIQVLSAQMANFSCRAASPGSLNLAASAKCVAQHFASRTSRDSDRAAIGAWSVVLSRQISVIARTGRYAPCAPSVAPALSTALRADPCRRPAARTVLVGRQPLNDREAAADASSAPSIASAHCHAAASPRSLTSRTLIRCSRSSGRQLSAMPRPSSAAVSAAADCPRACVGPAVEAPRGPAAAPTVAGRPRDHLVASMRPVSAWPCSAAAELPAPRTSRPEWPRVGAPVRALLETCVAQPGGLGTRPGAGGSSIAPRPDRADHLGRDAASLSPAIRQSARSRAQRLRARHRPASSCDRRARRGSRPRGVDRLQFVAVERTTRRAGDFWRPLGALEGRSPLSSPSARGSCCGLSRAGLPGAAMRLLDLPEAACQRRVPICQRKRRSPRALGLFSSGSLAASRPASASSPLSCSARRALLTPPILARSARPGQHLVPLGARCSSSRASRLAPSAAGRRPSRPRSARPGGRGQASEPLVATRGRRGRQRLALLRLHPQGSPDQPVAELALEPAVLLVRPRSCASSGSGPRG